MNSLTERRGEPNASDTSSRRQFLLLAATLGLVGPSGFPNQGIGAQPPDSSATKAKPTLLGQDLLARGLMAMSQAHKRGWAQGHYGAAVLSSYYFGQDHQLDERTSRAIRVQVDAFVARRPAEFPKPDPGHGTAKPERILERLDPFVSQLGSGGHHIIYSALALQALRDLPEFATPSVVDGICKLLDVFAERYELQRGSQLSTDPPYQDAETVAVTTLRAMLRPWSHVMKVGAGNVVHWVTLGEALVTLEKLGHRDLARRGHAAHRVYLVGDVKDDGGPTPERDAVDWLKPAYWESSAPREPQNGSWFFGHSFKLPYSLFRLLRCTQDQILRNACLARAAKLSIPFE